MYYVFAGFLVAVAYGVGTSAAVWWFDPGQFDHYVKLFFVSFNCVVSGGLIVGGAIFLYRTQESIPEFVESSFDKDAINETDFPLRGWRRRRAAEFS